MEQDLPPLLLRPHYVSKPWGGRRMETELGRGDLPAGPVGESWEVYDLPGGGCSVVDGGVHDGRPLRDVLGLPFPLLIKVLDASADLSVQVHPDGHDGGPMKEEAWVALADGGAVAVADADDRSPLEGLPPGRWLERLRVDPLSGGAPGGPPPTVVHVPGGTVHAILAGALLLEVQNPCDVTWRLDDYGRPGLDGAPRPLHLAAAADVLARPTPFPALLEVDEASEKRWQGALEGERFGITLLSGGPLETPQADALYFTAPGVVVGADGSERAVPAHRIVVLPDPIALAASTGWVIAFAAR